MFCPMWTSGEVGVLSCVGTRSSGKVGVFSCAYTCSSDKVGFCPVQTPVPQSRWDFLLCRHLFLKARWVSSDVLSCVSICPQARWVFRPLQTLVPQARWEFADTRYSDTVGVLGCFVLCRHLSSGKASVLTCIDTRSSSKMGFCPVQTPVPQARLVFCPVQTLVPQAKWEFVLCRHPILRQGGCPRIFCPV